MDLHRLEKFATRHFVRWSVTLVLLSWTVLVAATAFLTTVDIATKFVDAFFKIAAVIVGAMWVLNRYFTMRSDVLQLRVDPLVEFVRPAPGDAEGIIVLCRLDIVNTSKTLTSEFAQVLTIEALTVIQDVVSYQSLGRWPPDGSHPRAPIEPGSWSAISVALPVPAELSAVRVHLDLTFNSGARYTWHRHFVVIVPNNSM
jgi:hypothetical protein